MAEKHPAFGDSILQHARKDFLLLRQECTVAQAMVTIREKGIGEKIIYFYAEDEAGRLVGVIPTRRLLTAPAEKTLAEIMVPSVVAIPQSASVLDACEYFVLHRFLAFPVVNQAGQVVGIVDVGQFTDEIFDIAERQQADIVFEALGVRLSQVKGASPIAGFRYRFPWLLATISSGTGCAMLAGAFEATLAKSLVLAFFLAMVLGLAESVAMQSMTVTIQSLFGRRPTFAGFISALSRELLTAMMIGGACAISVTLIVLLWRRELFPSLVIGGSIFCSHLLACGFGQSVPWFLHWQKLDPKIAAGPITLALTDILTLLIYFSLARTFL